MNSKLLLAFLLAGGHLVPESPFLCSAPPEGDDGGGGNAPPPKTFTQADVDAAVTARLAREKAGQAKVVADAVAAEAAKRAELEAQIADLSAKMEDAGKSGAEKAQAEAARAAAAAKTRLDAAAAEVAALKKATEAKDAELASAKHAHRTDLFKIELSREMLAAKALPAAVSAAVDLLVIKGELAFNDDGRPTLKLGERVFDKPSEAVAAFLKDHSYFASHPGGGNGTKNTGNGQSDDPASLEGLSSGQLLARGLAKRAPVNGPDVPGA